MSRRIIASLSLLALMLVGSAPEANAANGAVHLTGTGGGGQGSQRSNGADRDLACLGIPADYGDIAEVTTSGVWPFRLLIDGDGHAHITFTVSDFTYAVYPAPGPDLANPGDPGYLFSGTVASETIRRTLGDPTPDQFGDVTSLVSIPITMHSGDGTQSVDAFYDILVVIHFDGTGVPVFIGDATIGGTCS